MLTLAFTQSTTVPKFSLTELLAWLSTVGLVMLQLAAETDRQDESESDKNDMKRTLQLCDMRFRQ